VLSFKRPVLSALALLACFQVIAQASEDTSLTLPKGAVLQEVPGWLPLSISPGQYWWWRKYGPLDYKTRSSKFRSYTAYNFGATAAAAKMSQDSVIKLAAAAAPSTRDIGLLDSPILADQFNIDANDLETLREMIESDVNIIRIARDFT
jgi:hypothetical protein